MGLAISCSQICVLFLNLNSVLDLITETKGIEEQNEVDIKFKRLNTKTKEYTEQSIGENTVSLLKPP